MKTTKLQYEAFKKFANYWLKELGLHDWHVYFAHKKLEGAYAQTAYHVSSRTATIRFNTSWDEYREPNDVELKLNALHEVLHIAVAPLLVEAEARYSTQLDIDAAEHALVVRLTNVIGGLAR